MKTLDKVLIIVGSFIAAFIIATVVIYTVKGWQYDVLIPCVVGGGLLETVNTMVITVNKIKKGKTHGGNDTDDSGVDMPDRDMVDSISDDDDTP